MIYSGMSIIPARLEKVNFTIPYWQVNQGIAVKNGSTATIEQFKNGEISIGVRHSSSADQWMQDFFGAEKYDQMVKEGKINLYDSFPMSVVALEQGHVESVIFDDVNIENYIQSKPQLVLLDVITTDEYYGVAVRKDDNDLRELMNEGLTELMASEKWNELIAEFLVTEMAEPTIESTTAVPTSNSTVAATPTATTA